MEKSIHDLALIEEGVTLGEGCRVAAYAVLKSGVTLGKDCLIDHHVIIGGEPQDLKFDPSTPSGVVIGPNTVLREGVTVHRATQSGMNTTIGADCLLMGNCHVGHDSVLGDNVILANGVLVAGHITVGDHAFISGNVVLHQHIRVGEGCIISGGSRIGLDVPPYVIADGKNTVAGLNLIGLKRRGHSAEEISDLKDCYRAVYMTKRTGSLQEKAAHAQAKTEMGQKFLQFFSQEKRGFIYSGKYPVK
ncbi:MAG: acyl-ACP--UDP-N-acetylglucosamine O-acyltransferase [Verrucomicrobiota bacterium]